MLTADGITAARAAADRRFWITTARRTALSVTYMTTFMTLATRHGAALRAVATGYFDCVARVRYPDPVRLGATHTARMGSEYRTHATHRPSHGDGCDRMS